MGAQFEQGDGMRVRPRVALMVSQFVGGASPQASATFASDPAGAVPFTTKTRLDRTQFALSAGLQMLNIKGALVTADALASGSRHTQAYGLSVRMEMPF